MHNQKNYYDWRREAMHRGLTVTVQLKSLFFNIYELMDMRYGAWLCKRHDFFMIYKVCFCYEV